MTTLMMAPTAAAAHGVSANDRLKRGSGSVFAGSVILATLLHFALFEFFPAIGVGDVSFSAVELSAIDIPPEIEVPPPPEAIARPAVPVVSEAKLDTDVTIAPTTFEENPVEHLPPPPAAATDLDALRAAPTFTPYTIAPELKNRADVVSALQRYYPALLRDAGVGGTALLWFLIDAEGRVVRTQLKQTSGYAQLDEAAEKVAELMVFRPAQNRDRRVPVWVALEITFTTM